MKIAIDCHTLEIENWAGKEQFLNLILEQLTLSDKDNEYIIYFRKKVFSDKVFPNNWRIKNINLPTPFWQIFVATDLIISKTDLILIPCAYLLSLLSFFTKTLIIIHDLTTFLPETKRTHKLMTRFKERLLLRLAIMNAYKIITISENTKEDIIKYFQVAPEKIKVIYLAAKNIYRLLSKNQEEEEKILKKYNLTDKFILFVGTLEPRKNIITLVEAYYDLIHKNEFKSGKLVLVGKKGWFFEEIFNKVKELNLDDWVVFTGYIPDEEIVYLYNLAVCFVYPSIYEGFGLPVVEAMSCGCPTITSNTSSLPEVAGEAAILINPKDKKEITAAMEKILLSSELRIKMSQSGIIQAKKFSWEKTTEEIRSLYGQ